MEKRAFTILRCDGKHFTTLSTPALLCSFIPPHHFSLWISRTNHSLNSGSQEGNSSMHRKLLLFYRELIHISGRGDGGGEWMNGNRLSCISSHPYPHTPKRTKQPSTGRHTGADFVPDKAHWRRNISSFPPVKILLYKGATYQQYGCNWCATVQ